MMPYRVGVVLDSGWNFFVGFWFGHAQVRSDANCAGCEATHYSAQGVGLSSFCSDANGVESSPSLAV